MLDHGAARVVLRDDKPPCQCLGQPEHTLAATSSLIHALHNQTDAGPGSTETPRTPVIQNEPNRGPPVRQAEVRHHG